MKIKLRKRFVEGAVLMLLVLSGASIPAQASSEQMWRFKVFLDDKEIGYHQVNLRNQGEEKKVTVNAYFKVKFLFFTAFQYRHRNYETWKDGCLQHLESDTDQNGENFFIRATTDESYLNVETGQGESQLEGCVRSFAYWDPSLLDRSQLLNTQNGDYEKVELANLGTGTLSYEGGDLAANQYRLTIEEGYIDLFYDDNNDWIGLKTTTEGGRLLSYVSEKLIAEQPPFETQTSSAISVIK